MKKNTVQKVHDWIMFLRNTIREEGQHFFGTLGFVFGLFALISVYDIMELDPTHTAWTILAWSIKGFGWWLALVIGLTFWSFIMKAILRNKQNFAKKK